MKMKINMTARGQQEGATWKWNLFGVNVSILIWGLFSDFTNCQSLAKFPIVCLFIINISLLYQFTLISEF